MKQPSKEEENKNRPGMDKNKNAEHQKEETPIYLTSDSTLQTPSEHEHDQSVDPTKDTTREVSRDDLNDIKLGTITGRESNYKEQE